MVEEIAVDGKCLEELGFKPKSHSVKPDDKEAVRMAVAALRKGTAQMVMGATNLAYYLSHHILADRFNSSESIYTLSGIVAEQSKNLAQAASDGTGYAE